MTKIKADTDTLFDIYKTQLTQNAFSGSHQIFTPKELVEDILSKIDLVNKKILVLFNLEFVFSLVYTYNIPKKDITVYVDHVDKEYWCNKIGVNCIFGNGTPADIESRCASMKFDVVVGNPPFNIGNDNDTTLTGVSGKTKLFKDFTIKASDLVDIDGILAFITPKGITQTLKTHKTLSLYEPLTFSYMSNLDVWDYDTCYFILKNNNLGSGILHLSDPIYSKFLDLNRVNTFRITDTNKSDKELNNENTFGVNGQKVIRYLPGKRSSSVVYDLAINLKRAVLGPKVSFTHLDSFASIIANSDPVIAGTTFHVHVNSMNEAQRLELFLKNNKLIKLMKQDLKFKKSIASFKFFKKFDLTQIQTGFEYPTEYGFTCDEISYIEDKIK